MNSDSSPFRLAEEKYFSLRGQLDTGRIARVQFDEAMAQLMLRDPQGRYWALGSDTGRWNLFQAGAWVEAAPYPGAQGPASLSAPASLPGTVPAPLYTPPPPAPPPYTPAPAAPARAEPAPAQSGGCGCGRTLGCGCLFLLLLLLACGGGGYWAYTNHIVTAATLLNLAGFGPGRIEVDNFRDDAISVSFSQLDAAKNATPIEGSLELNAFDVKAFHTPQAARLQIDFTASASRAKLGTCTLSVRSGDQIQFVALADKIVVNRVNSPPASGTDLVVSSSTLCR